MAYDEQLADRVRQVLIGMDGLSEKRMFGGVGFLSHGNMICGVLKDQLILRVGADAYEDALRSHSQRRST